MNELFKGVRLLTQDQYTTLKKEGKITVDGVEYLFDESWTYVTPTTLQPPILSETDPTTDTEGEIGQIYFNTTTQKMYLCTKVETSTDEVGNEIKTYTWSAASADVDTSDFVTKTDYATVSKAGIVSLPRWGGLEAVNGQLYIKQAADQQIKAKSEPYVAVTVKQLDLAVKVGVTTNNIELTADEKTAAQTWLGLNNKLEMNTDGGSDRLYGVNSNGVQTLYGISTSANPNSIARRTGSGILKVKDPVENDDAATKLYVDSKQLTEYLKSAVVTDNMLVITKADGSTLSFEGGSTVDVSGLLPLTAGADNKLTGVLYGTTVIMDTYQSDETKAKMRIGSNNEFNFDGVGNVLYIGYNNTFNSETPISKYYFGRHAGDAYAMQGEIYAGKIYINNGADEVAAVKDIPTNNNQLTNGAGYITSSGLSNYVTLNTAQTITGVKTFGEIHATAIYLD